MSPTSVFTAPKKESIMLARFWTIITAVMLLATPVIGDEIKIASWNIENFGQAKAGLRGNRHKGDEKEGRKATLERIVEIIEEMEVDLIAIQEVEDKNRKTLPKLLCTLGEGWNYVESERTGEEQYAIFFKHDKLEPDRLTPKGRMPLYDVKEAGRPKKMKRLPGYCSFETKEGSFDFTIITCHNRTWGDGAAEDAKYLDDVYKGVQRILGAEDNDIILLGDFNIEKEYKKRFNELLELGIKEAVTFGTDTMLSKSNSSTVDNIFYPKDMDLTLTDFLEKSDEPPFDDEMISDHYPVWATFDIPEVDEDKKVLPALRAR